MSYIDDIVTRIEQEVGADRETGTDERELHRIYALLVLVKGGAVSRADVHDAWALWRTAIAPEDPDIVPFDRLDPATRAKDMPFVRIIRSVAEGLPGRDG